MINDSLNIKTTPFHLFESKVPLDVCDKLREANSAITDSKFLSNIMSEKVAEWESISNSKFKQSVDFKKVMKNVNPNALNTIASPGLPPEFSRVVSSLVLPKSNYEYLVQMIKCSHIDWHSDKYVLNKELKCVDGIFLVCLSDNPLCSEFRLNTGHSHTLKKGDLIFFDDHIEHSLLPPLNSSYNENQLNNSAMQFASMQRLKNLGDGYN